MGLAKVIWSTLTDFGRGTSIAGLNNAAKSPSRMRSCYWLLIFGLGFYKTIDGIFYVVEDFLEYPVITSTNLDHKVSVQFPAITVCSLNRVHCLNLLAEHERQVALRQSHTVRTPAKTKQKTLETIKELKDIFQLSRCVSQLCTTIEIELPPTRDPASPADGLVFAIATLDCSDPLLIQKACYHLAAMAESGVKSENINSTWTDLGCTQDNACRYNPKGVRDFTRLSMCPQISQGSPDDQAALNDDTSDSNSDDGNVPNKDGQAAPNDDTSGSISDDSNVPNEDGQAAPNDDTLDSNSDDSNAPIANDQAAPNDDNSERNSDDGIILSEDGQTAQNENTLDSNSDDTNVPIADDQAALNDDTSDINSDGSNVPNEDGQAVPNDDTLDGNSDDSNAPIADDQAAPNDANTDSNSDDSSAPNEDGQAIPNDDTLDSNSDDSNASIADDQTAPNDENTESNSDDGSVPNEDDQAAPNDANSDNNIPSEDNLAVPNEPLTRKKRSQGPDGPDSQHSPGNEQQENFQNVPKADADFVNNAKFMKQFMKLSEDVRASIGHRYGETATGFSNGTSLSETKSFIVGCSYRGENCNSAEYWYHTLTSSYGNCYTFNYAQNANDTSSPRKASLTGNANGFTVELFLDQNNYMLNKLSKKAGARLVIHDPEMPPLPDEYGLDLQPNTASSIAIQKNEITRKPYPYTSNCTSDWTTSGYEDYTGSMAYSLAICQRYCLQEAIVSGCDCFHPNLFSMTHANGTIVDPCFIAPNISNADYVCFKDIMNDFDTGNRICPCNVACKENEYTSSVTVSTWPSNQYWFDLAMDNDYDPVVLNARGPKADAIQESIQQNFVKAEVYYQTLNVRSLIQSEKYLTEGFFSGLGGALSLYLGVAIIMCFEILELLYDLFINVWTFATGKQEKTKLGLV